MEGELEAMNLGRGKPSLADEIDALAADDMLSEELGVLKQSMEVERMHKTSVQFAALFLSSVVLSTYADVEREFSVDDFDSVTVSQELT